MLAHTKIKTRMLDRVRRWGASICPTDLAFVRVEACSACQLKCPACPTGRGENRNNALGVGHIVVERFRQVLRENPEICQVELSNYGEVFLHKRISALFEAAAEQNVGITLNNGANLNRLSDEAAEALVRWRIRSLSVSLDGASASTYAQYRVGGNFETVLDNIRRINRWKAHYRSSWPKLIWQFVVFGHNEHEIEQAQRMARSLNMVFRPKLNWSDTVSPVQDEQRVRKIMGVASRREFLQRKNRPYLVPCFQLWNQIQINWDGKLLGCCVNRWGDFGNVFETGLKATIQGRAFRSAKLALLGRSKPEPDNPCLQCESFEVFRRQFL